MSVLGGSRVTALRLHRASLAQFLADAAALPPGSWERPCAAGKWSPAQTAEHLLLAYETLLREMRGGAGMATRARGWRRLLLRAAVLPLIVRFGWFPRGATAPREVAPAAPRAARDEMLALLGQRAAEFERVLAQSAARGALRLTHPYFGPLSASVALRFCGHHIEHHRRQLPAAAARTVPTAGSRST